MLVFSLPPLGPSRTSTKQEPRRLEAVPVCGASVGSLLLASADERSALPRRGQTFGKIGLHILSVFRIFTLFYLVIPFP